MDHLARLAKFVRRHAFIVDVLQDLVFCAVFGVVAIVTHLITPFYMYIPHEQDNVNVAFPHTTGTIPSWLLPLIAYIPPLVVIALFALLKRSYVFAAVSFMCLLSSALACDAITNLFKIVAGRPRPDFYDRLAQDPNDVDDAYKSFPSGHASIAFNGLAFCSLLLAGQLKVAARSTAMWRCLVDGR